MQRAAKKRDESLRARRERNRQAQHDFRRRRQAAEEAQRRRVHHLENTIEELSNVLIGLCDVMLGTEAIKEQPSLMARLQRSVSQVLKLTASISDTNETDTTQEPEDGDKRRCDERNKEIHPQKPPKRKAMDPSRAQQPPYQRPSFEVSEDTASSPTLDVDTDDSNIVMETGLTTIAPLVEQTWALTHTNGLDTDSFPVRLVETTLSQACLLLSGDVSAPEEEMERAFGSTLRLRTRPQLIAYWQWMLGPGRNDMYQAMGINWTPSSARSVKSYFDSFLPPLDHAGHESSDKNSPSNHLSDQTGQPEFLTALGVQEQLQSLGVKLLSPNTMELSIRGPGSLESDTESSSSSSGAFPMAQSLNSMPPATLTVRFDTFLLASNLGYMARCLEKGPVYPRHGIAGAVERSVILACGG
ncbi:hypothetical protein GQ53DRAFT_745334 [Thozetella sp. PMI_491]|nr:hypothetical protein GQ53DRAFT_745334 [Thozetella sp. PMI_491]